MSEIWVIAEHRDGELRKVSLEALAGAQAVAADLGAEITAVLLGTEPDGAIAELGKYGAAKVLHAADDTFDAYSSEGYANAIAELAGAKGPAAIMFGASVQGKDLSGRLAAKLGVSVAVDCVKLAVEDGRIRATRPMYAGKVLADVILKKDPQVVSLRPNVFDPVETGGQAAVEAVSPDAGQMRTKLVDTLKEAAGKIELTEAQIIVSGGRGMKEAENFSILEELAAALGAAVGASRSAVDAGWRPHVDQVGQTGKVVTPNLYIACGISGAIQHLAGMGSSKVIVAINKDPDAPIHLKADYSVVADLFDIVPALKEEVVKLKQA